MKKRVCLFVMLIAVVCGVPAVGWCEPNVSLSAGREVGYVLGDKNTLYMLGTAPDYAPDIGHIDGAATKPTPILSDIASVSAGATNALAVGLDGVLYGWGHFSSDSKPYGGKRPVQFMDGVVSAVSAWEGGLALREDGSLWGWGGNSSGQVGNGTFDDQKTPVKILERIVSFSAGIGFACAVDADGALYAWGNASHLGLGWSEDIPSPTRILETEGKFSAVSCGGRHTLLLTRSGTVLAFGDNTYSQLGSRCEGLSSETPVKVLDGIHAISAGENHNAAISGKGILYIWGQGTYGQLGVEGHRDTAEPVALLSGVSAASAGSDFTVAVRDGNLYGWGSNDNYSLFRPDEAELCFEPQLLWSGAAGEPGQQKISSRTDMGDGKSGGEMPSSMPGQRTDTGVASGRVSGVDLLPLWIGLGLVGVAAGVGLFANRRRAKKDARKPCHCPHCGESNPRAAKVCRCCGKSMRINISNEWE